MLFHSRPLSCFTCHGGNHFSNSMGSEPRSAPVEFHNTGLYNLAARSRIPAPNTGLHEVTGKPEDVGKFKVPTLRNIAITGPYMHDGSVADAWMMLSTTTRRAGERSPTVPIAGSVTTIPTRRRRFAGSQSRRRNEPT